MSENLLPSISSEKVVKALKKCGFAALRQKGSHLVSCIETTIKRVVVSIHKGKDIKKGLLRKIIVLEAQISVEEFLKLL